MFLFLLFIWIVFNGKITTEIIVFGVVIASAVFLFLCRFMDYSIEKEKKLYLLLPDLAAYFFVLLWEIIKANIDTARFVLNQKVETEPQLIRFTTPLRTDFAKVMRANSITLTPGTITVEISGGEFRVHCLDRELAEGIEESVFVRRLLKIEEKILR